MKKISKKVLLFLTIIAIGLLFVSYKMVSSYVYGHTIVSVTIKTENPDEFQVYYDNKTLDHFDENHSKKIYVQGGGIWETLNFQIPYQDLSSVRIDLGEENNSQVEINSIVVSNLAEKKELTGPEIKNLFSFLNATSVDISQDTNLLVEKHNPDMYFYVNNFDWGISTKSNGLIALFSMIFFIIICTVLFLVYKFTSVKNLIKELYYNRTLIFSLSKNDFKTKYIGSYLGVIWAFIQPIVTVLVYTFVFTIGFRSQPLSGVPFVNWLTAGILPWYFFQDALVSGSSCLIEYNYLVKKVVFNIDILPVVKILSALYVHFFFAIIVVILYCATGYPPDIYWIQTIYYCFCVCVLSIGLAYFTSAIMLFLRDLGQIINIVLQVGVWLTPIMWEVSMIPDRFLWIFKLNPMFYVVEGYRNSLIYKSWFWENPIWTIGFWMATIIILCIGTSIFKKLKPQFADVI